MPEGIGDQTHRWTFSVCWDLGDSTPQKHTGSQFDGTQKDTEHCKRGESGMLNPLWLSTSNCDAVGASPENGLDDTALWDLWVDWLIGTWERLNNDTVTVQSSAVSGKECLAMLQRVYSA